MTVRRHVPAAVVVGVDLVGKHPRGPEGGVEVEADLGEEAEVGPEPGDDDDLVDARDALPAERRDAQATVRLGGHRRGAELGEVVDDAAGRGGLGVLAELAALLELVVVTASERVAYGRAAQ